LNTFEKISSAQNPKFQIWKSLLSSKGIKNESLFILSGKKIIYEFIKDSTFEISCELMTSDMNPLQNTRPIFQLGSNLFNELDVIGTHFNLLVLQVPERKKSNPLEAPKGIEVIAPLGDPKNLGSLIRSCLAFGVSKIHLTKESSNPFLPQCMKSSSGSVLRAPFYFSEELNSWDSSEVWALDAQGVPLDKVKKTINARILIGEEGPGLGDLKQVKKVSIPIQNIESLNATVAASILLYSWNSI
jgi:RNA methyltransferase, TrmH family